MGILLKDEAIRRRNLEQDECYLYFLENTSSEVVCSFFGCGRRLSLMESLYGSKCQYHQCEEKTLDIVDKVIRMK